MITRMSVIEGVPEVKSAIDDGIEGIGGPAGEDSGTEIAETINEPSGLASVELISKSRTKTNKKPRTIFIALFLHMSTHSRCISPLSAHSRCISHTQ